MDISQIEICASTPEKIVIDKKYLSPKQKKEQLRAISLKNYIWPEQSIIYIGFGEVPKNILVRDIGEDPLDQICTNRINNAKATNGNVSEAVINSIKQIILERFQPYVNLTFVFKPNPINKYDVFIDFDSANGNWSYVGTQCKDPPQKKTMNLASFKFSVIMHEFGHVLGLHHEHQRPNMPIQWNYNILYTWGLITMGWDKEKIDTQIVKPLNSDEINDISIFKKGTVEQILMEYDPNSIMLYSFPAYLTVNGIGTPQNKILSMKDVAYLNALYPGNGINNSKRISADDFYLQTYGKHIDYNVIKFVIKTSNMWFSGTDSPVIISLYDPNYHRSQNMRPFELKNLEDPLKYFERGQTDTFELFSTGIPKSSLTNKQIILSVNGSDPWRIEKIDIYYNNELINSFKLNIWLGVALGSVKSIVLKNNNPPKIQLGDNNSTGSNNNNNIILFVIFFLVIVLLILVRIGA